jgi:heme exporter protein C
MSRPNADGPIARWLPVVLLLSAAALLVYAVPRVFFDTALERQMGTAQKIFYFHVPLAWVCMLFALVSGVAAGTQLRRRSTRGEALAVASGEMVVLSGIGVLATGPIWADATWGTPWTGDARQVTTALLWLVFVAYLLVQRYGPANADRLAAALAIFGAVDVPVIYYATKIWETDHPTTRVVGSLPQAMWNTLFICLAAQLCLAIALVWIRARQQRVSIELDETWVAIANLEAHPEA